LLTLVATAELVGETDHLIIIPWSHAIHPYMGTTPTKYYVGITAANKLVSWAFLVFLRYVP
jgi:hypothetical protein